MGLEHILKTGLDFHKEGRREEAARCYEIAAEGAPFDHQAPYLLGSLYLEMERDGLAIPLLMHAMNISRANGSKRAEIANNLGIAMRRCGHDVFAESCYKQSLDWEPDNVPATSNMSGFLVNQARPDECIEWSDKTLALEPENYAAMSHKAIALLEKQDFKAGFELYKSRYNLPSFTKREYNAPHWNGERVKLLAIHGEQGVGDEIMFSTLFHAVKERVDSIVIECEPRLIPLFERSFGVPCYGTHDELIAKHKPDAFCPMGTIPCFVWPPKPGHLKANPERVKFYREKLKATGKGPYIGLSWHGGTKATHTHLRNPGIEGWQSLVSRKGTFVSLQYGEAGRGAEVLKIPHWQEAIDSLDEMAALMSALDLHISVCNSSIHLAGALGIPCYVLTPYRAAWRYGLEADKMYCYDSVRLFRQGKDEDWLPVFAAIDNAMDARKAA